MSTPVVIGGAAGAWGDSAFAAPQLLDDGRCDYLIFEGLAEITMGILARAHAEDPRLGWATDVVRAIGREAARLSRDDVRVVTNAGGVNPRAAAAALREMAEAAGVTLRIGVVEGDDLSDRLDELRALDLRDVDRGAPLPAHPIGASVYLGARPIAAALDAGADVVITGRCVDSALVLGPLIHEHGWGPDDLDALAMGSLAGHLIECGPQSTGGLLTDWEDVPSWEDLGYPIVECHPDGRFVVTKPTRSGGLVDERTVSEQLLYEIGDPARYRLPDVTCDWRAVTLAPVGPDRVEVTGARGTPPPATLKAGVQAIDGYKLTALLFVGGRDAARKGARLGRDVRRRVERTLAAHGFEALGDYDVELLGTEHTYGPFARADDTREVVVKIALHHAERAALDAAAREIPSFGLAVPGLSGGGTGRPRPTPRVRLSSVLVPRERVHPTVAVDGEPVAFEPTAPRPPVEPAAIGAPDAPGPIEDPVEVPLVAVAHARSGDKGPHANIGVRARHPDFYPWLCDRLTAEVVAARFAHRVEGEVTRWALPGVHALNFLLADALGGGGIASLRFDPQGKAYAQQLLDLGVEIPRAWLAHPALRR